MIRIVCDSPQAKGKLFEYLIRDILKKLGFDEIELRCRRIGSEYDLEATNSITKQEIIGECKALAVPLASEHLWKWLGKYTLRSLENSDCAALFFTLSPLGSEARSLYKEIRNSYPNFIVYESTDIANILEDKGIVVSSMIVEERFRTRCTKSQLGQRYLVYAEQGLFWAQLFLEKGVPTSLSLVDSDGNFISRNVAKNILSRDLELSKKAYIDLSAEITQGYRVPRIAQSKIVSPPTGAGWFDYRYPAPPNYFVGRFEEASRFREYLTQVRKDQTVCRGLVIHGPSGVGKTSFILKLDDVIKKENCFSVVADCRACAGSDFLYLVVDALKKIVSSSAKLPNDLQTELFKTEIFKNGLFVSIDQVDKVLHDIGSTAIIFLDQFEYLVQYPEVVDQIKNILLYLTSQQSKIVLGFAIRSDLTIDLSDFPFNAWSIIKEQTLSIKLRELTGNDVERLIEELEKELGLKLEPAFIEEITGFSKYRPWILKRVCAYLIQAQRKSKLDRIVKSGLKLDQLFEEDLDQLDEDEIAIIKAIAKKGGATTLVDLQTPFKVERTRKIVGNLVAKRLAIRIGHRYDLYHEQFRRYIIERFLAREERIQVQIDPYVRMLQVLISEKNFEAIRPLLNTLHRLYVRTKTTYRIEEIVELLTKVQMVSPLGYMYHELKARALAKLQPTKKSELAYKEAINSLIAEHRSTAFAQGFLDLAPLSPIGTYYVGVLEEIERMKFDSGDVEGAQQTRTLREIFTKEHESTSSLFKELGKSIFDFSDEIVLRLIREFMSINVEELSDFIKVLSKSPPEKVAWILAGIDPSSTNVDLLSGLISDTVRKEVAKHLEDVVKDYRNSSTIRLQASKWLANLDADRFLHLGTQSNLRPFVLKHLHEVKDIPAGSVESLIDLFLQLPPRGKSRLEIEDILYEFSNVWDKVVDHIPASRIDEIMDHLLYMSKRKRPNLKWFVALYIESLIDCRSDLPPVKTANLALRLAKDQKATIKRKAVEIIAKLLCTIELPSQVKIKMTEQLHRLLEKEFHLLLNSDRGRYIIRIAQEVLSADHFRST